MSCASCKEERSRRYEAERLLAIAKDRIRDMLMGDDGQAWKEARKFLENHPDASDEPDEYVDRIREAGL